MRLRARLVLFLLMLLMLPVQSGAEEAAAGNADQHQPGPEPEAGIVSGLTQAQTSLCQLVDAAAQANNLPASFFARLIWQESHFRADAVGPVTRSGAQALGIAQFMPATASERGLLDPFDPVQALPKSAEFLSELRHEFGNLGLAAAAYNAGPRRVREWLDEGGPMPSETRGYVYAITGITVDDWAAYGRDGREPSELHGCQQMVALLRQPPRPYAPSAKEQVPAVAARPWGVQLSAGFHRSRVLAAYSRLARRHAKLLSGHNPTVLRARNRSRGTRAIYQVQVGTQTRAEADALCNRIRGAGGACLVLRNPPRAG